jgi:hypothetical protein
LTLAIENAAPFALDPERDALLAEGEEGLTPEMSEEQAAVYRARLPANVEAATASQGEAVPNISSGATMQNEQEIVLSLGKNGVIEHVRTADGRFVVREGGEKPLNEDHQGATPEKNVAGNTATSREARVDSGDAEQEPVWELSSGELQKKQTPPAPLERNPQLEWDFRIGKNGAIDHFRSSDGRVAVREVADKIHILAKDHDAMALALERALERFGGHLHFEGNQAGAQTLVDIVVTRDLQVTFTDDRLNAQIQLSKVQNDLDRGRLASTAEGEQTSAQKRGAGASASESMPEKKIAGNAAHQQVGEVFLDAGAAPFEQIDGVPAAPSKVINYDKCFS